MISNNANAWLFQYFTNYIQYSASAYNFRVYLCKEWILITPIIASRRRATCLLATSVGRVESQQIKYERIWILHFRYNGVREIKLILFSLVCKVVVLRVYPKFWELWSMNIVKRVFLFNIKNSKFVSIWLIHQDFNIYKVTEKNRKLAFQYKTILKNHPNQLAKALLFSNMARRTKRINPLNLVLSTSDLDLVIFFYSFLKICHLSLFTPKKKY